MCVHPQCPCSGVQADAVVCVTQSVVGTPSPPVPTDSPPPERATPPPLPPGGTVTKRWTPRWAGGGGGDAPGPKPDLFTTTPIEPEETFSFAPLVLWTFGDQRSVSID